MPVGWISEGFATNVPAICVTKTWIKKKKIFFTKKVLILWSWLRFTKEKKPFFFWGGGKKRDLHSLGTARVYSLLRGIWKTDNPVPLHPRSIRFLSPILVANNGGSARAMFFWPRSAKNRMWEYTISHRASPCIDRILKYDRTEKLLAFIFTRLIVSADQEPKINIHIDYSRHCYWFSYVELIPSVNPFTYTYTYIHIYTFVIIECIVLSLTPLHVHKNNGALFCLLFFFLLKLICVIITLYTYTHKRASKHRLNKSFGLGQRPWFNV